MSLTQVTKLTTKNRHIIEFALQELVEQCDWIQPVIKRFRYGTKDFAWDKRSDGLYPIYVFRDEENYDYVAIPSSYDKCEVGDLIEFTSHTGNIVAMDDREIVYIERVEN